MLFTGCIISYSPFYRPNLVIPNPSARIEEPTVLEVTSVKNKTIGWFQARMVFEITTDVDINMSYYISGRGNSLDLIPIVNSSAFSVPAGTGQVEIAIKPIWTSFPSSFEYNLSFYYINSTTQKPQFICEFSDGSFTLIMGVPVVIIFGSVLGIGVTIILISRMRLRGEKNGATNETDFTSTESYVVPQSPIQSSSQSSMPAGKIMCPECKEKIAEGSAFCPECGFHIPKFLRIKE